MVEIKSTYYRKSRVKIFLRHGFKKVLQMGVLVIVGEYLLLYLIRISLSEQPLTGYVPFPSRIINLAVEERPIFKVAQAYSSMTQKNESEFDRILSSQYPAHVKGARPDFRTINLQDKEGAKVGYVLKF
ncbi:MAG: hypothetical protein V1863_05155 [Candidatus Omnitrophota bacterium]